MNPDDKLAAILRMRADQVEPSAAGWDAITTGIAARRVRTRWLRGGALAGAVLTVVALLVFTTSGHDRDSLHPAVTPTPTETPSEMPTTSPSPSVSASSSPAAPVPTPASPAPFTDDTWTSTIWPLTSYGEVRAWEADHSRYPELETVEGAALAFAKTYLGIPDATVTPSGGIRGEADMTVQRGGRTVSELRLSGFGPYDIGMTAPFLVTDASLDPGLVITAPSGTSPHDSPITASGGYSAADPSLTVTLFADVSGSRVSLASAKAETHPSNAWTATLPFSTTARYGSMLVTNPSLKDGGVAEAAAVPVRFGTPPPPSKFVAMRDGRIAELDTATGAVRQWLSRVGVEAYDPRRVADDTSVVYVERTGTCSSAIRKVGGGTTETLVTENAVLANPTVVGSSAPISYAYERTGCAAGDAHEVVLHDQTHDTTVPVDGEILGDLAAGYGSAVAYVVRKDGVTRLHRARYDGAEEPPVAPPAGCSWAAVTWGPPPYPGQPMTLLAAARCGSTRLYRLDPGGGSPTSLGDAAALDVTSLCWSADGDYLVVGSQDGGTPHAYVWRRGAVTAIAGVAQRPSW